MTLPLLDRAICSYADVDRLLGLHHGTARRWLEGYVRQGRFYDPILRPEPTGSDAVTWGEMVEARLIAEYRSRRAPLQRLRPAIVALRDELGPCPLAQARPFLEVEGHVLVRGIQDGVGLDASLRIVVVRSGQLVLSETAERFRSAVEYDHGIAARMRILRSTPEVAMDPQRSFGQPAVRGVRTAALAEDYQAGTPREELVDLDDLTPQQVDDALRFELITRDGIRAA